MAADATSIRKEIAANFSEINARIAKAAAKWGRGAPGIDLIAVSKRQPDELVAAALENGHRLFGENRVQEAAGKWPAFRERYQGIELHLIGPLQSNKAKEAVALFDVIETVDRVKIARALATEMQAAGRILPVYIQINTGKEPQKAGIFPEEADAFIRQCREEFGLNVVGLMCIPPVEEQPAPHFALLARIAERNGLSRLSMGMSADFETAVQFGATSVRVGTALFGLREG
ncbi:MAG: YggS family pyridoxal phosphate-dependent enzyme [Sneathiella sp.]|jgi:pyridoxal phosphate enzyme (YggS family)|uniref:YggS family pyridoxal phosphate-dependent enzyme n=1 Tax=Sneathiella sp. TaxID=1964365 RepID=UPI000C57EC45|nr:YggS family pyridoxal phosphate-dependent enzyme [Sneathiella sp.]MAL79283.1 YggS family pyridoxal phosphate-dependent enzyme [Sneathiella sp.]|tara:strand:- start:278 stop:970 length:693 start_codon:yes stop_codon:yes gene_type:complete